MTSTIETFRQILALAPALPAPMCGYTDRAQREIAREFGAGLVYTEMLSIEGLARGDRKTEELLDIEGERAPVAVQIFGSRAESAGAAARACEDAGAAVVDLNMGCPARKVVGSASGAALLKDRALAGRIVAAAVRAISVPLTVKMRWDWDEEAGAALELARICEAEGAAGVCLHARTRAEGFGGQARWSRIAELKAALSIPVIGNGDIRAPSDALAMRGMTRCDAVMIGRGLMGAPWLLAGSLRALRESEEESARQELGVPGEAWAVWAAPPASERIAVMRRHALLMAQWKGESKGLKEFRKHAVAYLKGLPNSRALKDALMRVQTIEELERVLGEVPLGDGQECPATPSCES